MRESEGGEIACCGSFLPKFVALLPNGHVPTSDHYVKSLNKVLKTVVKGTRLMLRQAAELQLGPTGINLQQTAITSYFKPKDKKTTTRKKIDWSDTPAPSTSSHDIKNKKKNNNIIPAIVYKNRNLRLDQIFSCLDSNGKIYWEFKAD